MERIERPPGDGHAGPPLISVIMIFLNAEPFIEEAIESVFAQTWPHWELVLVDDGSTDRSTTIARGYAERHPERVRYLEHPGHANRGTGASRNLGITHACGEYIAFLDADDVYLRDRLAKHVAVLETHAEVDMVQSTQMHWHSWEGNGDEDHLEPSVGPLGVVARPPIMLRWSLSTQFGVNLSGVTVRREAVAEVGGFEDVFTSFCEDLVFKAKMYATKNIFVIDECLARYRRHPDSVTVRAGNRTGDEFLQRTSARKAYFLWLRSFLESRAIDDPSLGAAVEHQLRLEDEQSRMASAEGPGVLEATLRRLGRLMLPNSVRVHRRNRRRARMWQQARAELEQLRREYEAAADRSRPLKSASMAEHGASAQDVKVTGA